MNTVLIEVQEHQFGNITDQREEIANIFKYAGQQYDQVTGQYYLRARYYNPVIGRFTQEGIYHSDGLNLYSYVANNPVRYVDFNGHNIVSPKRAYYALDDSDEAIEAAKKADKEGKLLIDTKNNPEGKSIFVVLKENNELDKLAMDEVRRHGQKGVMYDGNQRPDFTPFARFESNIDNMSTKRNGSGGNYEQMREKVANAIYNKNGSYEELLKEGIIPPNASNYAKNKAKEFLDSDKVNDIIKDSNLSKKEKVDALANKIEDISSQKINTIHEVNNPKTQIVPYIINSRFNHAGGVSDEGKKEKVIKTCPK